VSGRRIRHEHNAKLGTADVIHASMKQRVFIEFVTPEEVSPIEIHRCLNSVCWDYTVDVSTVRRWVRHFKSG
jgi:hypothetical protein